MKNVVLNLFLLFLCEYSIASIRNVPGSYPTIQSALDSCSSYDTVLVQAGTYYENIQWPNSSVKGLSLLSQSGSSSTIIDGGGIGRVININGSLDSLVTISGFTIQHGMLDTSFSIDGRGAGIYLDSINILIDDVFLIDNLIQATQHSYGAGLAAVRSKIQIRNSTVKSNRLLTANWGYGGGIYLLNCSTWIENSYFLNNYIYSPTWNFGGGIYVESGYISIIASHIRGNVQDTGSSWSYGAGVYLEGVSGDFTNCLIAENLLDSTATWRNGSEFYAEPHILDSLTININYCTIINTYLSNSLALTVFGNFQDPVFNLTNSIVWGVGASEINLSCDYRITSSNIKSSTYSGVNTISAQPLFSSGADYHPMSLSPGVNGGILNEVTDLDGNSRPLPLWHNPDMGCYEIDENLDTKQISGHTYLDVNTNGILDTSDYLLNNIGINFNSPQFSSLSNNGFYSITLPYNNYNINANIPASYHLTSTPSSYNIFLNGSDTSNIDFGFYPDHPEYNNIETFITSGLPRCNSAVAYTVYATNSGIHSADGTIEFVADSSMTFISSVPSPDSVSGNSYYWHFSSLDPFDSQNIVSMNFLLPGAGSTVYSSVRVNSLDSTGNLIEGHGTGLSQLILCSFDPNEKIVNPAENISSKPGEWLNYSIYFQNTGNDTAFNIRVIDTLSSLVSMSSLEIIESTHLYSVQIEDNNVVSFIFNNILLPDSGVDLAGSQGHISYRIKSIPGAANNSQILNTAHIYFDFNSSISTNTTITTIQIPLGIKEFSENVNSMIAYPNPFSNFTRVKINDDNKSSYNFNLYDLSGRIIRSYGLMKGSELVIERGELISGLYILQAESSLSHVKHNVKLSVMNSD